VSKGIHLDGTGDKMENKERWGDAPIANKYTSVGSYPQYAVVSINFNGPDYGFGPVETTCWDCVQEMKKDEDKMSDVMQIDWHVNWEHRFNCEICGGEIEAAYDYID
tara:strand:+ start:225 stop:545 length:321 start_codon:yes stop_codon:yes gene_type:complete